VRSRSRRCSRVKGWFGILGKQALFVTDFKSKRAFEIPWARIYASGTDTRSPSSGPKPRGLPSVYRRMLDRMSAAVH
jgi:hypothetical protein